MSPDGNAEQYYQALKSHDRRFDGLFYVGVSSTGIYCRPVCTAKTPKRDNCKFFSHAAAAEQAGYRPCLRCRPELAPGKSSAPVDAIERLAYDALQQIEAGVLADGESLEHLAEELDVSSRHLRRSVQQVFGVSPVDLAQTHRLLMAKRLLQETRLPITEIALASGFRSLRRFNALFRERYQLSPSQLRKEVVADSSSMDSSSIRLMLSYRPPYAWASMLAYLKRRAIPGVEWVTEEAYSRTVEIHQHQGWLSVTHAAKQPALEMELSASLLPVLPVVLGRVRRVFDLDARPDVINALLTQDPILKPMVDREPGLRVAGAFDGFETALRTILGQQITVAAATTLMARLCNHLTREIKTPFPELNRLPVHAAQAPKLDQDSFGKLGIIRQRSTSIIKLAEGVMNGSLRLEPGTHAAITAERLLDIPGIGPWTVQYLAMRVMRQPDAFPASDLGVRIALNRISAKEAEILSKSWSPWRAYAVQHLWNSL